MQSSYIPWKGYFDLIRHVDEFILFDDVQYTKRDWRSRNRIKSLNGPLWLSVPVHVKGRYLQAIRETQVSDPDWNIRHWRTIQAQYGRAPFFDEYRRTLQELFDGCTSPLLSENNRRLIAGLCTILGITTTLSTSMQYSVVAGKTERVVALCKQAGATEYVSGPSARGYIDPAAFEEAGVTLTFFDYSGYPEYTQLYPPFDHHVSVIDLIVHTGPRAPEYIGGSFEIILVNDGSPDRSLEIAVALSREDPHVRVIDLSRNFGHHKALMTGLMHARGELVFLLDSDLEEEPEWLRTFHDTMITSRADVVYGVQKARKGHFWERVGGSVYYATFNAMLERPIPKNVMTARLMTRRYVDQLVRHTERELCIAGLWVMTGFDQVAVPVDKGRRPSASTYAFADRVGGMVNAITSFSTTPLVYIFYLGCAIMITAGMAGVYLFYRVFVHGVGVEGWPSLIVSVWFLGGVTIFCVGVIGMYVAKVFTEAKQRPYTIVRAEYPERSSRTYD